jgi:hypothetical protein
MVVLVIMIPAIAVMPGLTMQVCIQRNVCTLAAIAGIIDIQDTSRARSAARQPRLHSLTCFVCCLRRFTSRLAHADLPTAAAGATVRS